MGRGSPSATIGASELIQRLSAQYRILDLSVQEPQIEDTVRRIYEQGLLGSESCVT
jgi:ABC-type uncharacterized transport system ATPase subunit